MPNYDASHYDPPAPVAQVTLRDMKGGSLLPDVMLLVDSGADVTLLPRRAVERLGVKPLSGQNCQLLSFDGTASSAQVVELDMIFLQKAYRGRYLLIDQDHGVLGRDVLCNVALLLDGPVRGVGKERTGSEGSEGTTIMKRSQRSPIETFNALFAEEKEREYRSVDRPFSRAETLPLTKAQSKAWNRFRQRRALGGRI